MKSWFDIFSWLLKVVFESTENQFRKSFSVKSMYFAAMKNRFSEKSFSFNQNFTLLTWKSSYIAFFTFKRFSEKAQKRERATKRKNSCKQNTLSTRERERTIGVDRDRDHRNCADRRRHDRDLTINASRDRDHADQDRRDCDRDRDWWEIEIGEIAIEIGKIAITISLIEIAPISIAIAIAIAISLRKCDLF